MIKTMVSKVKRNLSSVAVCILIMVLNSDVFSFQDPIPAESVALEKPTIVLITPRGFEDLLYYLNDYGKRGYKLELTQSSDDGGMLRRVAAVMRLVEGNSFEYELIGTPNRDLAQSALNVKAEEGYRLVDTFALTFCGEPDQRDASPATDIFRMTKGDIFLLERANETRSQIAEYRVINAKIGLGRSPTKEIQSELDSVPVGFRPVRVLFSKTGMINYAVSVLLEKTEPNETKTEFRFIKEVTGFERKLNAHAKEGFEFIYGRRIGMTRFALMARRSNSSFEYAFLDMSRLSRDLDRAVSDGFGFHGVMFGDVDCSSGKKVNERAVLVRRPDQRAIQHRVLQLDSLKPNGNSIQSDPEILKMLESGYEIRGIFYSKGFNVVLSSTS